MDGQARRAWLNALADDAVQFVPPELRPWLGIANELNPIVSMERAGQSANALVAPETSGWGRVQATGDMLSNMAGVVGPVVAGSRGAVPAVQAAEDALMGWSTAAGVPEFMADEFGGIRLLPGQSLDDALRAKYPNVKLSVTGNPERGYTVGQIVVPQAERGAGIGTAVMRDLLDVADEQGATVALTPSGDFGGSVARLREFYRRFGFVPNKGRGADYSISEGMYRRPQSGSE